MFDSIGRRLALLNAVSVLLVIALVGVATFLLLRTSLTREADRALSERADAAQVVWSSLFADSPRQDEGAGETKDDDDANDEDRDKEEDDHDDDEGHELIESGDTLLYAFDRDGTIIADARGTPIAGLPLNESVQAALTGDEDRRTVTIGGETVRVYTKPVRVDGAVVGAIQAARGQSEHESELRLIQIASIAGVAFGALISIPSGMFLARRAMRPISEAFDRQRAFVADASHELRTPLAVIRANAELVKRMPESPETVQSELDYILDEVDSMTRLVDDLLLLARVDDSSLLLEREERDLVEIATSVLDPMRAVAAARNLELRYPTTAEPLVAFVDAGRVRQVLRILIDNAFRYTPSGGAIAVSMERQADRMLIRVQDTGIGIAPEEREKIFRRFYRAEADRARNSGGAGLGLTIARALVVAHGGDIGVESEQGQGSTFWFTLPTPS